MNEESREITSEEERLALLNILEDVEEERRKAKEERDKTLAIIKNLTDGLLFFDKEERLSLINPQAERLLNVKEKEVVGKTMEELATFEPLKPFIKFLQENRKSLYKKEFQIGEDKFLEVSSVIVVSRGEKIGTLIILHDISREKIIERMKTEFVSISAHQLRTPLSAIKWILKMILDGDLGPLLKTQKEYLEKAYTSNERMINLINDLLNVSRIEEGRFLYRLEPADLRKIIEDILNTYKKEIQKKKLEVSFRKPRKFPSILLDKEKIGIAVQNLIENAIRYTPEKGKIILSLKKKNKEIEFFVKDTGIGIPKEQQARIFSKFFRAKNAVKMEPNGSGLGLFVTKKIIEAHGGKIWFESEEGKGTTFYFTLPLKLLK